MSDDPFEPVPRGWEVASEDVDGETMRYLRTLTDRGEHGMIAYDPEGFGGYFIPGASPAFQGPYSTLELALEVAEANLYAPGERES